MPGVLITGGSGLVGTHLGKLLVQKGYKVALLGRRPGTKNGIITYKWDYADNYIDKAAFDGIDYIINLAGAAVAGGRWTPKRKKELYDSRVYSTRLLFQTVQNENIPIKKIISASAVGYYGSNPGLNTEETPAGGDFLSKVCADWENETKKFETINIPYVIFRIGIVLAPDGGFIKEMGKPIKMGFGAIFGSGKQVISWIHIDDLCAMLLRAVEDERFTGVYNAVSPEPVSNEQVTRAMAKKLHRPLWLPKVPAFALKIILGGMSYELLVSHNASARKIINNGFKFKYPELDPALDDVLK
jgi:uncharacterized protein (TIGR01777 family)